MNIFALPIQERKKREKFRCVHRHNGMNHPNCYDKANGLIERIGFVDVESSQLNASFGIILSYCILGEDGRLFSRLITPEELRSGQFDKPLCAQFCKDVRNFDRVIGWYSERFDMPFLRTRCIFHRLDYPIYKEIKHTDAWKVARKKLKMYSNRLGAVCEFFGIKAKEHPLSPSVWIKCISGDRKALDFVMTHNKEDVQSLKEVWHLLENHTRLNKESI